MLESEFRDISGLSRYSDVPLETVTEEEMVYSVAFARTMKVLEAELHSCEDPEEIAMGALQTAAEFYDGDWCGIIEGDLVIEAWSPVLWYNTQTHGMTQTAFKDLEETKYLQRWVRALKECKPLIIENTEIFKDSDPDEYEIYRRCEAHSVLAVPFWKNPVGFMIVRNPKRFCTEEYQSGFLQALAYVVFSSVTERKLLHRSRMAVSPEMLADDKDVVINLFGRLEICTSRGRMEESEINSPRICRFLVYMLQHKGHPVAPRTILEEIWSEEDVDNAGSKIKSVVYRLQSVFSQISEYRLVVSSPLGYQLNPDLNIMTDIQRFDDCWVEAQNAVTLQTKIELLKRATELYRGNIYPAASAEHWIMPYELSYKYKCLGIYAELMKIYFESQSYATVLHYASLALKLEKANVEAYFWMIRAMKQKDSVSMAKGELKLAEFALSSEEYEELLQKLEKANVMLS